MLLYAFGNSGIYYCLLSTDIDLLIFAPLSQQQCSQNCISDISKGDDYKEKKWKRCFFPPVWRRKKKQKWQKQQTSLSAGTEPCWDPWLHVFYHLCASLPGLGELEHDEKSYSSVIWPEDTEERSLKKVSSQGAHNWEAFQLPNVRASFSP